MLHRLDSALLLARRGATAAALAGGGVMLAAALLVATDVLLRRFANVSLGGADELAGYALAIGSAWSLAFVLLERGNVRIDALYQYLPRAAAGCCDLLALIALLGFVTLVAWHGAGVLEQSWRLSARSNSALGVPLLVPQTLWWLGYAWFVGCGALLLLRSLGALLARDWDGLQQLAGARSGVQDAADEIEQALGSALQPPKGSAA